MKDALQSVHFGKAANERKTSYQQIQENRLNENFRKLLELINNIVSKAYVSAYGYPGIPFGEVDDTSTSTEFTATVDGIDALRDGVLVYLKNGVVTSAAGCTLDVNGLGAKPIYQTQAAATALTTQFNVNYTGLFVYNSKRVAGGCWDYFYGYNSDTNTIAYNIRDNQSCKAVSANLYRYMFLFTNKDGQLVPSCGTSNSTSTNKTLTSAEFDPWGQIFYYAATTTVASGDKPSSSSLYKKHSSVNMRYAFNVSTSLFAVGGRVYVKCSPQSNGMVKLSGKTCITQSLPSTDDGYVYIFLGHAYSGYQIELSDSHPVYQYKNGALRLYTGP